MFFPIVGKAIAITGLTLLYHRSASAINTSVTTKNGVVTLSGKASNVAEMNLAAKLANDVNLVDAIIMVLVNVIQGRRPV